MPPAEETRQPVREVPGNPETGLKAVFFDLGGVMTASPFEAFASYERANGLPAGTLRSINAQDHHENAWARLERGQLTLDGFAAAFEAEALASGHKVDAAEVLALLGGAIRPDMVKALRLCRQLYLTAAATNNFVVAGAEGEGGMRERFGSMLDLFDAVIESARIGIRKPEPAFYERCCDTLGVRPEEALFIDDLGVNLKPARAIGMRTIKFVSEEQALDDLEVALQLPLR
jgi:putative hydrolase of the HAD superfamily